jgi:hypothetical protein
MFPRGMWCSPEMYNWRTTVGLLVGVVDNIFTDASCLLEGTITRSPFENIVWHLFAESWPLESHARCGVDRVSWFGYHWQCTISVHWAMNYRWIPCKKESLHLYIAQCNSTEQNEIILRIGSPIASEHPLLYGTLSRQIPKSERPEHLTYFIAGLAVSFCPTLRRYSFPIQRMVGGWVGLSVPQGYYATASRSCI